MDMAELDDILFGEDEEEMGWNRLDEWEDEDRYDDRNQDSSQPDESSSSEDISGEMRSKAKRSKDRDSNDNSEGGERPERMRLLLPSSLGKDRVVQLGLESLASQEIELRQGQANDALADLRIELGHKSLLFRTKVRQSSNTKGNTRAWKGIRKSSMEVMKHVRTYRRAQNALRQLDANQEILDKYKDIQKTDLKVNTDMVEENRFGQRSDTLAWFWRMGPQSQSDSDGDEWMRECEFTLQC
jgi:hypothetical protein